MKNISLPNSLTVGEGTPIHRDQLVRAFIPKKLLWVISALLGVILVVWLVTWLSLSLRPDMSGLPADSGFYAYIGKAILHGQVLYRDVWDDKPPLGYYLNALAQAIFGQTSWGVWWSGIIWISGCTLLFFFVIKKLFGGITAGISSALFLLALMNPELFEGGNLMEVYALLPQIAIIGVGYLYFTGPVKPWLSVIAGILTAAAYLIKQPSIVLGCALILLILVSLLSEFKIRAAIKTGVGFILGFIGLVMLVALYWLIIGSFGAFVDGAILQGFSFIGGSESYLREYFFYTLVNVIPGLFIGRLYLIALLIGGIFLLEKLFHNWIKPVLKRISWPEWCLVAVLLAFPFVARRVWPHSYLGKFWLISIFALGIFFFQKYYRQPEKSPDQLIFTPLEWSWLVGVVALPVEVLMASLGGRYFGHYFITMIPAVILVIAYPIWRVILGIRARVQAQGSLVNVALFSIPVILIIIWGGYSIAANLPPVKYTNDLGDIFKNKIVLNALEEYIIRTTQPKDEVLVWHIHLGIDFVTDRKAPSRFLFPLNLFIPPTEKNTRLKDYVDGLEASPPELIIFQKFSSISLPFVDQPIDQLCVTYCTPEFEQAIQVPQIRQQWLRLEEFVQAHYSMDTHIYDWTVLRRLP